MIITERSHLDHGLAEEAIAYILGRFHDRDSFFIESIELPESVGGSAGCALYGPAMSDSPIGEDEVQLRRRGDREYMSRMIDKPMRPTRTITVIAGPTDEERCILYTAFGGPVAPREPGDPDLVDPADIEESAKFWSEHALSLEVLN